MTTMVRFSDACFRQRSALTLSFLGGYAVLLVPLFVISSDYPILPPESCSIASMHFYCFGTPSSVYYSVIDRMCIAGVGSIFAAMLYAIYTRAYLLSAAIIGISAWLYLNTISSTLLPGWMVLISAPIVAGIILTTGQVLDRARPMSAVRGRMSRVLSRPTTAVLLLMILAGGTASGLWGLGTEAIDSLEVTCTTGWDGGPALTLGLSNPSFGPVSLLWKVIYNYSNSQLHRSDTESIEVAAHSVAFLRFNFGPPPLNATLSGSTFDVTYASLLAAIHRRFVPVQYGAGVNVLCT